MNLATILGICLLSLGYQGTGWVTPAVRAFVPQIAEQPPAAADSSAWQSQGSGSASQPQAPPPQTPEHTQPLPTPAGPTSKSAEKAAKPSSKRTRHHNKTIPPNCSNSSTALNPAVGNPADATNTPATGSMSAGSTSTGSTSSGSENAGSTNPGSTNAGTTALPPCPPPKKVVHNGGSNEPSIQLVGGAPAEQSPHQRSTDQLAAATEENLKKVAGRQLNPSQQEMVNQINQFLEQSKTAAAAGDLERGHNLALKAQLLSDELVKP